MTKPNDSQNLFQDWPNKSFTQYSLCRHWRETVRVGRSKVTCSGSKSWSSTTMEPYPDFGVYLATQWKLDLGMYWTNGAYVKRIAQNRPYPAIIVDVPDMKAPPVAVLNTLVEIIVSKMKQGKLVDIGCIAGHGRTGTLLACLIARKEHLDGRAAIAAARERYCPMAVENREQEQAVSEYVNLYLRNRR